MVNTLKLPNNYRLIEEEEMMYTEGGWSVPRWAVSAAIDAAALLTPIGWALAPIKYLSRKAAASLVTKYAYMLSSSIQNIAKRVLGVGLSVSSSWAANMVIRNISSLFSVGGVVGFLLDARDGNVNGWISW